MQQTITIYCKNNNQFRDFPLGISLLEIYNQMDIKLKYPIVAARVNHKVEDLNFHLYKPKDIEFIDASSPSGLRVYLRSISMVMAKALYDLMPQSTLRIEHPICKGYYCCIDDRDNQVDPKFIEQLKERMQQIIAQNLPIISEEKQTPTVVEMFRERGQMDKVILLETLGISYARFFRIGDFIDYYNGVLVPSTGYVPMFNLIPYDKGILLQVPDRRVPDRIADFEDRKSGG